MKKRNRFLLILAVLGICFFCLSPSINWYYRTPEAEKTIALASLEKIRDYSIEQAVASVKSLEDSARANPQAEVPADYNWLVKEAKANYKKYGREVPKEMTMGAMLSSFGFGYNGTAADRAAIHGKLVNLFQERYRQRILKNKKNYANSVKLGLDLAGGVNVIIRADLDAAVAAKGDSLKPEQVAYFKQQAMATAIETITSRIDRFDRTCYSSDWRRWNLY